MPLTIRFVAKLGSWFTGIGTCRPVNLLRMTALRHHTISRDNGTKIAMLAISATAGDWLSMWGRTCCHLRCSGNARVKRDGSMVRRSGSILLRLMLGEAALQRQKGLRPRDWQITCKAIQSDWQAESPRTVMSWYANQLIDPRGLLQLAAKQDRLMGTFAQRSVCVAAAAISGRWKSAALSFDLSITLLKLLVPQLAAWVLRAKQDHLLDLRGATHKLCLGARRLASCSPWWQ
jgi:hypothetical protein